MAANSLKTASFSLLDGTTIPWLAWGNGSGTARTTALDSGLKAIAAGIRHIDTAQGYKNEGSTGEIVAKCALNRDDIYVTTKLSETDDDKPVPIDQVRASIAESIKKLGFIPDLFLIHNPFVAASPSDLKAMWGIFEDLKSEGKLKSIGVSNFRPQDLELILEGAKFKPVVNQVEYHPYTLAHLAPVLAIHAKHGIVTESYGPLTPILRHPTGGPLKPVLERIAARITTESGKNVDTATVLLLWTRAQGVVAVTASGNAERIKGLAAISHLPDLLTQSEIDEITTTGKKIHFRHYTEHMERDFPLPNLPNDA